MSSHCLLSLSPQLKHLSVRALTLISFRDIVLLKTDIFRKSKKPHANQADLKVLPSPPLPCPTEALQVAGRSKDTPPQIRQMLLVLQSVHRTPPTEQFLQLQSLLGQVLRYYLCMVPQTRRSSRSPGDLPHEGTLAIALSCTSSGYPTP